MIFAGIYAARAVLHTSERRNRYNHGFNVTFFYRTRQSRMYIRLICEQAACRRACVCIRTRAQRNYAGVDSRSNYIRNSYFARVVAIVSSASIVAIAPVTREQSRVVCRRGGLEGELGKGISANLRDEWSFVSRTRVSFFITYPPLGWKKREHFAYCGANACRGCKVLTSGQRTDERA